MTGNCSPAGYGLEAAVQAGMQAGPKFIKYEQLFSPWGRLLQCFKDVMLFHTWNGVVQSSPLILGYRKVPTGRAKFFQEAQCICFLCTVLESFLLSKGQLAL